MSLANTVRQYLTEHHIAFQPIPHNETSTSRESAHAAHVHEDHVAKAVIVKDKQGFAMIVIPANHWLKLDAVNDDMNREFELASESETETLFKDCQPGAIPPLGPAYGIETCVDSQLLDLAEVFLEGGDHTHLLQVSGQAFQDLLKGARRGYFSHSTP